MTLPALLEALAARLPERVQVVDSRTGGKKALGHDDEVGEWVTLAFWDGAGRVTHSRPRDLLALLMQEIEARGWSWVVEGAWLWVVERCDWTTGYRARVSITNWEHVGRAPTPGSGWRVGLFLCRVSDFSGRRPRQPRLGGGFFYCWSGSPAP